MPDSINTKECSKCHEIKLLSDFGRSGWGDGLRGDCKKCRANYYQLNKERCRKWEAEYYKKNRVRILRSLKSKKWRKNNSIRNYIGCERNDLIKHIESQFQPGMSWENRSEWHIDHIIPLSSAKNENELYELCHYSNLRPLWAVDNIKKGKRIVI